MIKISKQHEKNEMRKIQMTEKQEFWDIYNEKKERTGRTMKRNDWCLKDGEYHLTVLGVIKRTDGRFLITKRVMTKAWAPGCWILRLQYSVRSGRRPDWMLLRGMADICLPTVEIIREKGITILWMCIVFLLILTSQISSSRRKKQMDICLLPLRRSKNLGRKENSFIMTASDRRLFSR